MTIEPAAVGPVEQAATMIMAPLVRNAVPWSYRVDAQGNRTLSRVVPSATYQLDDDSRGEVFVGAQTARTTATRVVGGALIAGPVGAIVGASAKKNMGKVYAEVTVAGGQQVLLEVDAKKEGQLRQLIMAINNREVGQWMTPEQFRQKSKSDAAAGMIMLVILIAVAVIVIAAAAAG